jgi:hypothetical protein
MPRRAAADQPIVIGPDSERASVPRKYQYPAANIDLGPPFESMPQRGKARAGQPSYPCAHSHKGASLFGLTGTYRLSHELVTGIGGEGATVTRQKLQVARAAGAHSETPLDGFATWPESRGRDEGVRS